MYSPVLDGNELFSSLFLELYLLSTCASEFDNSNQLFQKIKRLSDNRSLFPWSIVRWSLSLHRFHCIDCFDCHFVGFIYSHYPHEPQSLSKRCFYFVLSPMVSTGFSVVEYFWLLSDFLWLFIISVVDYCLTCW